jgi:cytochrome c oxidase assembly protein subunit 11
MSGKPAISVATERSNRVMALALVAFFAGMVGMAYAAVPLYQLFCQVTGYGGTTQRVTQYSDRVLDRTIKVRFDANTAGVPWEFGPVQREVTLPIGETVQIAYKAKNVASRPTSGRATFNVTPQIAGSYFMKVECFCFTDTELQPGEEMEMPVVFYVDPAIVDAPETKNIGTLTLSYTFYPTETDKPVAAVKESADKTKPNADEIGG